MACLGTETSLPYHNEGTVHCVLKREDLLRMPEHSAFVWLIAPNFQSSIKMAAIRYLLSRKCNWNVVLYGGYSCLPQIYKLCPNYSRAIGHAVSLLIMLLQDSSDRGVHFTCSPASELVLFVLYIKPKQLIQGIRFSLGVYEFHLVVLTVIERRGGGVRVWSNCHHNWKPWPWSGSLPNHAIWPDAHKLECVYLVPMLSWLWYIPLFSSR
jgi:hypothetical protein